MRRFLLALLALSLSATLLFAHDPEKRSRRSHWGHGSFSINTHNDVNSDVCADHIEIYSEEYPSIARAEESKVLANQPLRVTASRNGGIHVRTWERKDISVKVCKVAAAENDARAQELVNKLKLVATGSHVEVEGPESSDSRDGQWSALVLIYAPAGAQLDLSAHNGGISLNKVNGNVTARTVNGGISLKESTGKMDIEARNGGISVKDCSGDMRVEVQNGGLSIELAEQWTGAGLDASTHNGGLSVKVPQNFKSSLEVASLGHGPVRCRAAACDQGQRLWDDDRKYFRIGSGTPIVRASTVNGGVSISQRSAADRDDD
jgi:DUF4097 and DUF4098 domain-containing protein YvlB